MRERIILLLLLVSLSGMAAIGFATYNFARQQIVDSWLSQLRRMVTQQEREILQVTGHWTDRVQALTAAEPLPAAAAALFMNGSQEALETLHARLVEAFGSVRLLERLTVCGVSGGEIAAVGAPPARTGRCQGLGGRSAERPPGIIDLWFDPVEARLHVLVADVLRHEGARVGTLLAVFDASELLATVAGHEELGRSGELLIVRRDAEGRVEVLTPRRYPVGFGPGRAAGEDPAVLAALQGHDIAEESTAMSDREGVPVLVATGYVPALGWGVVARIGRDDALRPARELLETMGFIFAVLSVAVLVVGVVLARMITRPTLHLADVVRRIMEGDTSRRAEILSADEIGYLARSFNTAMDFLDRKTRTLEESEGRMRAVFDTTVDGLVTIDAHGTIEAFNRGCEEIFGYKAREVLGRNVKCLMPEPYTSAHDGYLEAYSRTGRRQIIGTGREVSGRRKDGSTFPLELSVSEVMLDDRRIYCGILRDISERKEAEHRLALTLEDLRISNAELEKFAYAASHDLKSPLRAVERLTRWLEEDLEPHLDQCNRDRMEKLRGRVMRMEQFLDDLLEYSRAGRAGTPGEPQNLGQMIEDLRPLVDMPDDMSLSIDPRLYHILLPRMPLEQVFTNLLSNAVKHHGAPGGSISVGVRELPDGYEFAVRDDGPGIPARFHDRVFEMFQTLKPRDEREGSGMGLAFVKKIVTARRGQVRILSGEGEGACIVFTWPVAMPLKMLAREA
ncbi:PAS domain S-box protein [Oceanicella sp. SM1341]|uniref:PAS domain S-box protein n=1 Tax=Oceanicella sp. SM1341 TaxID=1548889 RepID=UPI0013008214|nr:PAS domain S-box protein [Oceanicella sp. SM1341]